MSDVLDIHRLAPKLDAFVEQTRSSGGIDGELLLKQAQGLLAKARAEPVVVPGADGPDAEHGDGAAGWHAVARHNLPSGDDIMCWRSGADIEASLYGVWIDGRLRLVELTVDDTAWGMRMTSTGASYFDTRDAVEGPADRRLHELIKRRTRKERQRVARAVAARSRICRRCSWVNEPGADRCAFCGIAGVPWELDTQHAERRKVEHVEPVGPTHELAVPEGYEASAFPELVGTLTLESVDLLRGFGSHDAATDVRGTIVLDGFDPDRKVSVIGAVIDAREQVGARRPGLAEAMALVEHLPAIVCSDVLATQAADIQRHLEEAGASTRFERSHD
jgi:ribosomal protein L7/L12